MKKKCLAFDKKYSLNEIENQLIRAVHKDARVHFVLNCAAISCPPLLAEALTETNLEKQLMDRTRKFILDASQNSFKKDRIVISSIFDWYQKRFWQYNPVYQSISFSGIAFKYHDNLCTL